MRKWRNGRRAGFRFLSLYGGVGSNPIFRSFKEVLATMLPIFLFILHLAKISLKNMQQIKKPVRL